MKWFKQTEALVRVHLKGDSPSIEGIFLSFTGGHYFLANTRVVQGEEETISLGRDVVQIPATNVLFIQRLSEGI